MKHMVQASLVVLMLASVSACFTEKQYSGYVAESRNVDLIKVGSTSKADVYDILGSPSSKGSFERDVWYYIGEYRSQTAFLEPKINNRQVVAVYFNPSDIVSKVERKTLNDGQKIKVVRGKTPSYGTQKGVFEELFGHVGLSPLPASDSDPR